MRLFRKTPAAAVRTEILVLLFFLLYYLYLWLWVDLRLIYHGGGVITNFPVFFFGWDFFSESIYRPGGLAGYISAFLAQFFHIGWAGAIIATAQAWLLWLCTKSIIKAASNRSIWWVNFVSPILLLILYSGYLYPFSLAMGFLTALGFAWLYFKMATKSNTSSLLVFVVLSIILFAIAGWAYLLFAVLRALYELLTRKRWLAAVLFPAIGLALVYVENLFIFKIGVVDSIVYFRRFTEEAGTLTIAVLFVLYVFLPVILIGLRFFGDKLASWSGSVFARITLKALPFAAGLLVVWFSQDANPRPIIEVDYYACQKNWPEVLQCTLHPAAFPGAAINPYFYRATSYSINRALYHKGLLGKEMFVYHQRPEGLFKNIGAEYWQTFDTYLELGQINLAEYAGMMTVEVYGPRPVLLKRLAMINMVKGNMGAAQTYLGALSRTLFDAGWANEYLKKIESDPNLSGDEEIQRLRSRMTATDRNFNIINDNIILDLLAKNPKNRMAFEYLMSFYLLSSQLDKFVENLGRLNDFDYAGIPRLYEEAILFYELKEKKKVELNGRQISDESRRRLSNFFNILAGKYKSDKRAAFYELARDYGETYFFYTIFGESGLKQ